MKNGLIVDQHGTKSWYLNDKRHRVDGPAEIWADGFKFWWLNGKRHRVDGPAEIWSDGTKVWYLNGKRHRVDGPAQEWADGTTSWFLHGKRLFHPVEFKNMEEFFTKLNTDENYSLPFIHKFNGLIEIIKNPIPKQKRLHAIKWKL